MYGVISDLYQGTNTDFVKCQHCQYESSRNAEFFDLQLTVKSEFDNVYNKSLEEALSNLLRAEMLQGDNQYECPTCQQKRDALKG